MTVLFDENVSHHLVEFLHRAGAPGSVQHVRKLGWNSTPDIQWMTLAIQRGFGIVSADRNDRTRGLAAQDLKKLGACVLLLGSFWDHLSIWEKAKWLVAKWELIETEFARMPKGTCALVDRGGKMTSL